MSLQIDFWQLVGLLLSGLGVLVGAMKYAHVQLIARLDSMEKSSKDEAEKWQRIERELLQMKADMPLQYVRREDYIRGQSVIEAKLDAVAAQLQVAQLRVASIGGNHAN